MDDIFKLFGTDADKEINGVWCAYNDDVSFLIARWGSEKHAKYITEAMKPYQNMGRRTHIPDKVATDIIVKGMVDHILLDWKGLSLKGKELPYNKTNAKSMLTALPELQRWITEVSQNMQLFQIQEDADAEKNSLSSSIGS